MKQEEAPKRRSDAPAVILALAIVVGTLLRIAPAALNDFPLNDGGMFAVMIDDLRAISFHLPLFTSYNSAGIPFAYPPLALYVAATIGTMGVSTFATLTWLPALLSIITIPAFYYMSRSILRTRLQAAIATALFALTPRALVWFLMGGGLTRSAGLLFSFLAIGTFVRLFEASTPNPTESRFITDQDPAPLTMRGRRWAYLVLAIIFSSLSLLSHPEAVVTTAGAVTIIILIRYRTWRSLVACLLVAVGVIILTAPWWFTVLSRYGTEPYTSAAGTSSASLSTLLAPLLQFNPAEERLFPLLAALGLLGLIPAFLARDWLLPVWMGLSFFIDPRSTGWAAVIPMLMLAALAITDLLVPAIFARGRNTESPVLHFSTPRFRAFVYILTAYLIASAALVAGQVSRVALPLSDRQAMAWARANSPPDASFLVVTGNTSPMQDPVNEWFPALAGRKSLTTIQGSEWTLASRFWGMLTDLQRFQTCFLRDATCLQDWRDRLGLHPGYIYLEKYNGDYPCPTGVKSCVNSQLLIDSLSALAPVAYENDQVIIFQLR